VAVGVVVGEGLAEAVRGCEDRRFSDAVGSDLGIAGGCTGSSGAEYCAAGAAEVEEAVEVLASANALRSVQSVLAEETAGGGEGEGVRGGGVDAWCNRRALSTLRLGDEESAGGEKGSNESLGEMVEDGKDDVRTGCGCCSWMLSEMRSGSGSALAAMLSSLRVCGCQSATRSGGGETTRPLSSRWSLSVSR